MFTDSDKIICAYTLLKTEVIYVEKHFEYHKTCYAIFMDIIPLMPF